MPEIADLLRRALRDEGRLAERLAPHFATARQFEPEALKKSAKRERDERQVDVAGEIERAARGALAVLVRRRSTISRGVFDGRLPAAFAFGTTFGDIFSSIAVEDAKRTLTTLVNDAKNWAAASAQQTRRGRGRPQKRDRRRLVEWVAVKLRVEGVVLTKARDGAFAQVVNVVEHLAGLPERDVIRDVRAVIDDEELWRWVEEQRSLHQVHKSPTKS